MDQYENMIVDGKSIKEWSMLIPFSVAEIYRMHSEGASISKLHIDYMQNEL